MDADAFHQAELVSIGLPVFNGSKLLRAAIGMLLNQTYQNIELIISDNCSTDSTQKISEEFASRDNRIKYFRQVENIGAGRNFRFVLEQARGKYFLWNASDDLRSADYLAVNVEFLEENPDYCASSSQARDEGDKFDMSWMGDTPLIQDTYEKKILTYFKGWHRNAIFYSIYRREVMTKNPILYGPEFLGKDWAIVMYVAKLGKFARLEQGELVVGKGGISAGVRHIREMRKRRVEWFFPHWELCAYLMKISKDFSFLGRTRLLFRAFILNLRANLFRLGHIFDA